MRRLLSVAVALFAITTSQAQSLEDWLEKAEKVVKDAVEVVDEYVVPPVKEAVKEAAKVVDEYVVPPVKEAVKDAAKDVKKYITEDMELPQLAKRQPVAESSWLEIPAQREDGYYPDAEVVTVMSGEERNYTFYYDFDTYTSLWVAYPLEARHMGSCERPKGWDYNPYLSVSDQVNLCSRSYADDYSRGHLIPNASRNGNRDMQLQTFYVTNSVPQVQDGFNGGIWQRLEAGLQSVAESERIYIVTGVAFEKMGEERDVVYTMARDDVKRVPVPKYFYKVALKVAYDDAGEVCDAQSVGFWFENRSYKGGFVEHTQSVDTIEEWTGFDFFPNLPDDVEVRAETNANWNKFTSF